jgi:amino-acid N-acetyltransferase
MTAPAGPADLPDVVALLEHAGLAADGVADAIDFFLVTREDERIVAVAGLEDYGSAGLLRSVAVSQDRRNRGLAAALVRQLIARSRARAYAAIYLRTTTADAYFARFGFRIVDMSRVPPEVRVSQQFSGEMCQDSTVMELHLDTDQKGART